MLTATRRVFAGLLVATTLCGMGQIPAQAAPLPPCTKDLAATMITTVCAQGGTEAVNEPLTKEQLAQIADRRAAAAAERRRQAQTCLNLMFSNNGLITPECVPILTPPDAPDAGLSREEVRALVETAIVRISLPLPEVHVGPDPSVNEWKMAVVGYPLWLWTPAVPEVSNTTDAGGFPLGIRARQVSTTFSMGDGGSVTCATGTPYRPDVAPGTPSPDCGYRYQKASLPKGEYTVRATTTWEVSWTALGQSGTHTLTRTSTRQLPVGELQAVVTR